LRSAVNHWVLCERSPCIQLCPVLPLVPPLNFSLPDFSSSNTFSQPLQCSQRTVPSSNSSPTATTLTPGWNLSQFFLSAVKCLHSYLAALQMTSSAATCSPTLVSAHNIPQCSTRRKSGTKRSTPCPLSSGLWHPTHTGCGHCTHRRATGWWGQTSRQLCLDTSHQPHQRKDDCTKREQQHG